MNKARSGPTNHTQYGGKIKVPVLMGLTPGSNVLLFLAKKSGLVEELAWPHSGHGAILT